MNKYTEILMYTYLIPALTYVFISILPINIFYAEFYINIKFVIFMLMFYIIITLLAILHELNDVNHAEGDK